jgi:hypothetical protein
MPFPVTAVNVMIASPGDVPDERAIIRVQIQKWNDAHAQERRLVLLPVGWESHSSPVMGDRAQAIINEEVLAQCDLLVGVFWTRLGTPTGDSASGTVEEINTHIEAGKPAMLYFSNAPVRLDSVDHENYKKLQSFKHDCMQRGLIETYDSIPDFREKFSRQLAHRVAQAFHGLEIAGSSLFVSGDQDSIELLSESRELLIDAAKDPRGVIMCLTSMDGLDVQTNGKSYTETGNRRSEAAWQAAIDQLVDLDLIREMSYGGAVFQLTAKGYQAADSLK